MFLAQQLAEYISAAFTGLWIQSHEHDDALAEIATLCRNNNWRLAVWDIASGLQLPGQGNSQTADAGGSDPLAAIRSINALASADSSAILVLVNFHRFLSSPEIVQALAKQISTGGLRVGASLPISRASTTPPPACSANLAANCDGPIRRTTDGTAE
jgi:hypothetical protein